MVPLSQHAYYQDSDVTGHHFGCCFYFLINVVMSLMCYYLQHLPHLPHCETLTLLTHWSFLVGPSCRITGVYVSTEVYYLGHVVFVCVGTSEFPYCVDQNFNPYGLRRMCGWGGDASFELLFPTPGGSSGSHQAR